MKATELGRGRTHIDIGGGRFIGLDDKIRGASSAAEWQLWKARGIIVKFASRQSKVTKAVCLSGGPIKSWKVLPLEDILLCASCKWVLVICHMPIYMWIGCLGSHLFMGRSSHFVI